MNIPVRVIAQGREPVRDKYIGLLFENLKKDVKFEALIRSAQKTLGLDVLPHTSNGTEYKKHTALLRSNGLQRNTKGKLGFTGFIKIPLLDDEVDKILQKYPFMNDWREGLKEFVLGGNLLFTMIVQTSGFA